MKFSSGNEGESDNVLRGGFGFPIKVIRQGRPCVFSFVLVKQPAIVLVQTDNYL